MTQKELDIVLKKHKAWISNEPDGERADLRWADLRWADLDFSCWPLWCGSLGAVVDIRIAAQIAYHFCRLVCDDPGYIKARNAILDFANEFHLVNECGVLEPIRWMQHGE